MNFSTLDHEESDALEVPFLEEEIHHELIEADGNKASNPDGFTFKFAQCF